ncbi:outer envelope protein 64, chloroplastic isoform X2 [Ananas comosus]|uniref:Outer envelope protein 64, chloroplastic isoform X2 n=1 Tax=Ananas comosus TaxID=4615 RepID=A0A6P5F5D9_ANACO|nr:outer envelope protein 64, chloroplastic isoform X2 [Ananas comosus]
MSGSTNLWVLLGLGLAGVLLVTRKLRRVVKVDLGAFVERLELLPPPPPPPPKAPHPLTGLTFAVADIFDIYGYVAGFGTPEWTRTHDCATQTSPVVLALVEGGATCVGKTVIDEMAFSITGVNKHFDTPTNPAAPERIPGGCSSGSAVAVAGGIVDFSLGVDTIGGVRVPGGFCGILGFRPSHAAVSNVGIIPVSPSLDTVGQVLKHVNLGNYLASKVCSLRELQSGSKNGESKLSSLVSLANAMRVLYTHEFKDNHMEWINSVKSALDSNILSSLSSVSSERIGVCHSARNEARLALNALLKDDGILVLPTVLGLPPKLNSREISSEGYNLHTLCLTAAASMSGCCQVTVPLGLYEKCPVSVSFIARNGGDRFLLDTIQTMYSTLQEQIDVVQKSSVSSTSASKEESAEIAKEKGNLAYKEKQWQKAINLYTEAIKLNGKNATYYSNRAAAYLELGSYRQAEADCTSAINLEKKNVKAYLRRGTAREMLGYYKEAVEDFKYALVLEPTNKTANLAVNRLNKLFQ